MRIRIQQLKSRRIHADPDTDLKPCLPQRKHPGVQRYTPPESGVLNTAKDQSSWSLMSLYCNPMERVNQCCGSGIFIPDPNFFHPGSRVKKIPDPWAGSRIRLRIKEFKYFQPKKLFLSSQKYDPECSSRIGIWFFSHPGSRIQGPKGHRIPDPQHCCKRMSRNVQCCIPQSRSCYKHMWRSQEICRVVSQSQNLCKKHMPRNVLCCIPRSQNWYFKQITECAVIAYRGPVARS